MVIKLDMGFDETNAPDFGSIDFDNDKDIILCGADIDKLNSLLTRAVCIGTYNVPVFSIKNGCWAFAADVSRLFMYEKSSDRWYEQEW